MDSEGQISSSLLSSCICPGSQVSSKSWELPGQWEQSPQNGQITWSRKACSECHFCWRASGQEKVWRLFPSLEFVCQWGQPHSLRTSEKLICKFSYRIGRERLILSSFPSTARLLSQTVPPITAPPGDFAIFLNLSWSWPQIYLLHL